MQLDTAKQVAANPQTYNAIEHDQAAWILSVEIQALRQDHEFEQAKELRALRDNLKENTVCAS